MNSIYEAPIPQYPMQPMDADKWRSFPQAVKGLRGDAHAQASACLGTTRTSTQREKLPVFFFFFSRAQLRLGPTHFALRTSADGKLIPPFRFECSPVALSSPFPLNSWPRAARGKPCPCDGGGIGEDVISDIILQACMSGLAPPCQGSGN